MYDSIHIEENDSNILSKLLEKGITPDFSLVKKIEKISAKTSNNCIGYYQFKHNDIHYKLHVIPKIFYNQSKEERERKTYNLLVNYFDIKANYSLKKDIVNIGGNIIDLSFESNKNEIGGTFQDLILSKYNNALNQLENFFKDHRRTKAMKNSFSSQNIASQIDLKKNIKELDKSIVHQVNYKEYYNSILAQITYETLCFFIRFRLQALDNSPKKTSLLKRANRLKKQIKTKYKFTKKSSIKPHRLLSTSISKHFKNNKIKHIYDSLKILSGLEHFNNNSEQLTSSKLDDINSVFFRPEKLYEWIVFDKLKKSSNYFDILKDGYKKGTQKGYELLDNYEVVCSFSSNPDFIARDLYGEVVLDAKWKIINEIDIPNSGDITKLKRDCELRNISRGILIYPKVKNKSLTNKNLKLSSTENFELQVIEIEI